MPFVPTRSLSHEPVSEQVRETWMRFGQWDRVYFPKLVGVEVEEIRLDYCRMRLPFRPELEQPMGIVHGGAIATLVDVVVVPAIGAGLEPETAFSTIDMNVHYINPLVKEDAVAEGWVVKRGRTVMFCNAEVYGDSSGRLIATGALSYAISKTRS